MLTDSEKITFIEKEKRQEKIKQELIRKVLPQYDIMSVTYEVALKSGLLTPELESLLSIAMIELDVAKVKTFVKINGVNN